MPHNSKAILAGMAVALGSAGMAEAAAIERAVPSTTRILFEEGSYGEIGFTYTDPEQSGDDAVLPPTLTSAPVAVTVPGDTGDVFDEHWNFSAAWKADINDRLSYAIIFDQPFGADTEYGAGTFAAGGFSYDGTNADLDTNTFSGIMAFDMRPDVKLYAGLRVQQLDADASIPFIGPSAGLPPYTAETDSDWGYGYLVGAAYSREEIALRIALTYYSEIEHEFEVDEFGTLDTEADITTPQSVQLDFQTGVAPKTLVFGSVRWVDWSEFSIEPPAYTAAVGQPLVDYEDDWVTYSLGVGRQLTNSLAGSLSFTYEPDVGGELTTLGPYDGRKAATAALSYDHAQFNVTGGVSYGTLGDTSNIFDTDFNDGSYWAAGLRFGYSF